MPARSRKPASRRNENSAGGYRRGRTHDRRDNVLSAPRREIRFWLSRLAAENRTMCRQVLSCRCAQSRSKLLVVYLSGHPSGRSRSRILSWERRSRCQCRGKLDAFGNFNAENAKDAENKMIYHSAFPALSAFDVLLFAQYIGGRKLLRGLCL